jgi:macrolide transport system ATP-binding/permease protein
MTKLRRLLSRAVMLFHRHSIEDDIEDEIQSHIQMQEDDNLRLGMDSNRARQEALRRFGGINQAKERYREMRVDPVVALRNE